MKLPLQITFRGMQPSGALEAAAAKKAHKLEEFCSDIMSCRVVTGADAEAKPVSFGKHRLG